MSKERGLVSAAIALCITGCVASQPQDKLVGAQLQSAQPVELCVEYHRTRKPSVYAELINRNALNDIDRQAIERQEPAIGMSLIGTYCLFGNPEEINSQTTAGADYVQRIYCAQYAMDPASDPRVRFSALIGRGDDVACFRFYVYTENGIVTVMQNQPPSLRR